MLGIRRFDKTASTLWNNLPSETRNEQSLEFLKKNVKAYFVSLLVVVESSWRSLTVATFMVDKN
jgi:hypothetical protein